MKKNNVQTGNTLPTAHFVTLHFVDEVYHANHPQLIHRHEDLLELLYVCEGRGRYVVGSREYALQPGNLVICNAGTLHGEAPFQNEEMKSYCCVVDQLALPKMRPNSLVEKKHRPVLYFQPGSAMEKTMLALYELNEDVEENHEICNQLSNAILGMAYLNLKHKKESEAEQKIDELVQGITEYLDEHFMEPITLQELGEEFHLSHYYLAHIFKEETGISPMKYIRYRRIGEAQNMLMNTTIPIQQIGEQLGFGSSCHLSSIFKKYVGISPSTYRKHFHD